MLYHYVVCLFVLASDGTSVVSDGPPDAPDTSTKAPNPVTGSGLTESDEEAILEAHNSLRGMVEPSATNMARLVRICGRKNEKESLLLYNKCAISMLSS